jgi:MFS family permease
LNPLPQNPVVASGSFAAMKSVPYRLQFIAYVLAMMADNIEHVISYWKVFQNFHSPALGGFAVLSHWLPFLFFSVPVGALGDRFDPRRIIQFGMLLFVIASLSWGILFLTDTLTMWEAMLILVIHGCAGVFWQTSSQLLLHDIVPVEQLQSAVRLNATGRYLGVLVGPAVGGAILLALGPAHGILLNALFYLPVILWLWKAPYGPRFRHGKPPPQRPVRGFADIVQTVRDVAGHRAIAAMILLAGAASFLVGNSYQAQMPGFAQDLGHGDPGVSYSMLLAADAAGALTAGILLESVAILRPRIATALLFAGAWCIALAAFAFTSAYPLALALLFAAGFFELSFSSIAQTVVQIDAPAAIRGRVIGLYNMSSLGLRAFSGVTVGLLGAIVGIHHSLAGAALVLLVLIAALLILKTPSPRTGIVPAGEREADRAADGRPR